MSKITEAKFTITGKSGTEYKFDIYTLDTSFKKVGGIYIFTRRYQSDGNKYHHELIYCGKTDDLSSRFDNHHKDDCIKNNKANSICVIAEGNEKNRTNIEEDILKGNNFKCNEVLN